MNEGSSKSNQEEDTDYSENESSNHDYYLVKAVIAATARRRNRRRAPQPMHNSIFTGSMCVEEILNGHEEIIQGLISMKSETFRSLSNLLGSRELLTPTCNMNGCIGAIDGTHVPCVPPRENADAWINCKGFYSQNILAACLFDMRFTYILTGGNVDINADYVLDDGIDGPGSSIGTQQHDSSRSRMNHMRDMIADDMWEIYQSSPWYKSM
ncbi:hypothetical protein TIFTF001_025829 [Ficus carica]|uniref:DUF8040 domain-containing protein n=1 Tax=Ficus carica TaxID=3494 RepID=A0AA88AJP3_FICCA|nr:hypothetical protein TIFTF001_025829 [Ficus carica]